MNRLLDAAIQSGQPASLEIELDFDRFDFIESIGVVILSNLIEWLRNRGADVSFRVTDVEKDAIKYLDDIGFFRTYWGKPLSRFARLRSTTFSFEALHCSRVHQWIDGRFFPWLKGKLNCHERSLYRLKASAREIFNNISDHSEEDIGCMHVQLHPAINRVKIAIAVHMPKIRNSILKSTGLGGDGAQGRHQSIHLTLYIQTLFLFRLGEIPTKRPSGIRTETVIILTTAAPSEWTDDRVGIARDKHF